MHELRFQSSCFPVCVRFPAHRRMPMDNPRATGAKACQLKLRSQAALAGRISQNQRGTAIACIGAVFRYRVVATQEIPVGAIVTGAAVRGRATSRFQVSARQTY